MLYVLVKKKQRLNYILKSIFRYIDPYIGKKFGAHLGSIMLRWLSGLKMTETFNNVFVLIQELVHIRASFRVSLSKYHLYSMYH